MAKTRRAKKEATGIFLVGGKGGREPQKKNKGNFENFDMGEKGGSEPRKEEQGEFGNFGRSHKVPLQMMDFLFGGIGFHRIPCTEKKGAL